MPLHQLTQLELKVCVHLGFETGLGGAGSKSLDNIQEETLWLNS